MKVGEAINLMPLTNICDQWLHSLPFSVKKHTEWIIYSGSSEYEWYKIRSNRALLTWHVGTFTGNITISNQSQEFRMKMLRILSYSQIA